MRASGPGSAADAEWDVRCIYGIVRDFATRARVKAVCLEAADDPVFMKDTREWDPFTCHDGGVDPLT